MVRLLTIIGARPQIIKAAALSRAIKNEFAGMVEEKILHTGQHYDDNMSQVFFNELGIPSPDYNLHVGSGTHGCQTAKMISGIEEVLVSERFDAVVVYGDTNSTLAAAVAANKLSVPIVHIEAGLRSFNMTMPEEANRIVCDHLSNLLFTPTLTGLQNIEKEGLADSAATFACNRHRMAYHCGDVMYDNSLYFAGVAEQKSDILERHRLVSQQYVLATIHRDSNTDNRSKLESILKALAEIAENEKVVLPLHPRTAKKIAEFGLETKGLTIIPPASFLDMTRLEKNARIILTDSGGVQKESYFFKKPCVIIRPETEWVEIVERGAAMLSDADYDRIVSCYSILKDRNVDFAPIFGDGKAATFILNKTIEYLS